MNAMSPGQSILVWLARVAFVVLLGSIAALLAGSVILGPALLVPALPLVAAALALEPVFRRAQVRRAAAVAGAAGAHGPIAVWGKVVGTAGQCPAGPSTRKGGLFAIESGAAWPPLCDHVWSALRGETERMAQGEGMPDKPYSWHDSEHRFELELHRERTAVLPGLRRLRVVASKGACRGGYRRGDTFTCTLNGEVRPALCPVAAQALRPVLAAMAQNQPDAPLCAACPIYEHMLVLQLDHVRAARAA